MRRGFSHLVGMERSLNLSPTCHLNSGLWLVQTCLPARDRLYAIKHAT